MTKETNGSAELKRSKAQFFKALAKLLGVVAVGLVPAFVGWLDAKTTSETALKAAATEATSNEATYGQLVDRIDKLEQLVVRLGGSSDAIDKELDECSESLIRHDERIKALARRHGVRPTRVAVTQDQDETEEPRDPLLKELLEQARSKKPMAKRRPKPPQEQVQQQVQEYLKGDF
jgi:hypothetical protein